MATLNVSENQALDENRSEVKNAANSDANSDSGATEKIPPGGALDFPDGGGRAWTVAFGTCAVLFCTLGYINSFGVYQAYYEEHQLKSESPSSISWIGSLQSYFLFSGSLLGGPLFDRYGAKVMRIPALFYILSIMLTSISTKLWHFILAQGVLGGISSGMTFAPSTAAVGQYFFKKRGAAMGMGIAGSSLGGVVFPIALNEMLRKQNLGFGWSVRILGFVILVLIAPSCLSIKARLPARNSSFLLLSAFKEPPFVTLAAAGFFATMGMFPPMFFLPSYAITQGMSSKLAFYLVAILNAASFPGRVLPGILADKYGRLNMLFLAAFSTGILSLCWQACHSNAAIFVYTALFGFCSGAIISGSSIGLASVPKDPRNIGTYIGMGLGIMALATLIGPPVSGAMVVRYHGFTQVSIFSGVTCLVGSGFAILAKWLGGHGLLTKA